ncbi:MAG: division/cell wall cluster transcriptional repressor MraZ [Actinomycetota bacterium]|nr:division/cell wall cluster transcriptional repressor MraZ [Actinomycetota bacterium]MDP8955169.1 division/cell wall cluster transcriptional repressor MraZ [Actinomycetota bacterium]
MFLGEFDRSLDPKGRVVLPADHREELGERGYLTKALDKCLAVFHPAEFKEVTARMEQYARQGPQQRRVATQFTAGAHLVIPDKQGRIAIPANLREYAGLTSDVKVVGGNVRIEIWDPQRWHETHPPDDEGFDASDQALAALGV